MRKIRMLITDNPKSLKKILMYIDASIVLHNMLIDLGDGVVHPEWSDDADVLTDIDDPTRAPEESVLELPVPEGADKGTRREQLKQFLRDRFVRQGNYQALNSDDDTLSL